MALHSFPFLLCPPKRPGFLYPRDVCWVLQGNGIAQFKASCVPWAKKFDSELGKLCAKQGFAGAFSWCSVVLSCWKAFVSALQIILEVYRQNHRIVGVEGTSRDHLVQPFAKVFCGRPSLAQRDAGPSLQQLEGLL